MGLWGRDIGDPEDFLDTFLEKQNRRKKAGSPESRVAESDSESEEHVGGANGKGIAPAAERDARRRASE